MGKVKVFHYGCSFTGNYRGLELLDLFSEYDYYNLGRESSSNFYILNKFDDTAKPNSIAIIQWSSLTRPMDDNFKILETSNNPLFDLLEQWYGIIEKAESIAKQRNIKLIQYVGWAIWKDDELNDYHRTKLKSYGIDWFQSSKKLDCIASNCFQFQMPNEWSSDDVLNGLHQWPKLEWGGMSEWIRENIDIKDRYMGYSHPSIPDWYDPHPSKIGTQEFTNQVLIPKINEFIQ